MNKWWNWLLAIALTCLLLIAMLITFSKNDNQAELQAKFDDYLKKFNKTYRDKPEEYQTRFQHFMVSMAEIDKLNSESRGPEDNRARYGLTKLSDMSKTEYAEIHLSDEKMNKAPTKYGRSWEDYKRKKYLDSVTYTTDEEHHHKHSVRTRRASLPMTIDWRTKGAVGPVRDQGLCGACWAFSTIGVLEAMAAIKTGKLTALSVQEVIDCAGLGNSGCAGGDICLLLDWLLMSGTNVVEDSSYPLKLANGVCTLNKNSTGVGLKSFTCDDFTKDEEKILEALATHGPVAVAVNALSWQNYLGGVIQYHCSGSPLDLNHAVELVGYDITGAVPYYIAKNSWGPEFGVNGYLHLAVGSNVCGLANEVASVDVK